MKQNGTSLNAMGIDIEKTVEIEDDHMFTSLQTPLRKDAFKMDDGLDRKSTRLNSSHVSQSRMPSSA